MTDVLEKYRVDARTSSVVWSAFNCNSCNSVRGGPSTVPGADVGAGILSGAWRLAFFYDRVSSSLPVQPAQLLVWSGSNEVLQR